MNGQLALYTYFGELGIFNENIPGHTFYQTGLLDSISIKYGIDIFDFYNYLDIESTSTNYRFPPIGAFAILEKHTNSLISKYRISFSDVITNIKSRVYSKLFLKARFRNLSTLQKKLMDTARFETIITVALDAGYHPNDIIILDTDLSMPIEFVNVIKGLNILIETPSITLPGIGERVLADSLEYHSKELYKRSNSLMYYGNLDSSNYKQGHAKNQIIFDIIDQVQDVSTFIGEPFKLTIAAKITDELEIKLIKKGIATISRQNREDIAYSFVPALASINVSKDLYLEKGFTPARVFESIALGVIPISYRQDYHPAMSFNNTQEFWEICKFLSECSPADYFKILFKMAESISNK